MRIVRGFDLTSSVLVNAVTTQIVDCGLVPDRVKLKITHFGNYVSDIGAWSYIQWDMMENNAIDPILNAIKDQIGTQYFPRELGYMPIVHGGSRLQMRLTNSHATINYGVGFTMKGYWFVD
jgi:hypothetical protein